MGENDYRAKVTLDGLTCRDTESLGRPDRILVVGAVGHDGVETGFAVTAYGIRGQHSVFEQELSTVFDGEVGGPELRVRMAAWDVDSNSDWVDNRDTVVAIADEVGAYLTAANPPVGAAYTTFVNTVIAVIDKFVEWDQNDPLMAYDDIVTLGAVWGAPHAEAVDVRFTGGDDVGYSDWDYTLRYFLESRRGSPSIFGPGGAGPVAYLPMKNTSTRDWLDQWVGDGVSVTVREATGWHARVHTGPDEDGGSTVLEIVVVEYAENKPLSTTTSYASVTRELVSGPQRASLEASPLAKLLGRRVHDSTTITSPPTGIGIGLGARHDSLRDGAERQLGGDHIRLQHDASLEMFAMHQQGTEATTPALRYVRPHTPVARALDPWSRDVMLHPPANL